MSGSSAYPEASANSVAAKAFEEQVQFADLLETTVPQSTAEVIDFHMADSFEAAAHDAVAA